MTKQQRNASYRNELIKNPTKAELIFKARLDSFGIRYLFQKGFIQGNYHCIVDFYLPKPHRLCIEIDGGYHDSDKQIVRDREKEIYLMGRKMRVIRVKNEDVKSFDLSSLCR